MEEGGNKILALSIMIGRQPLNILLVSNSNFSSGGKCKHLSPSSLGTVSQLLKATTG